MYGRVRTITEKEPIAMIKVSVYRPDLTLIDHTYTNDDGHYSADVPAGELVTVQFDTHHTLVNARSWQPSLVTNVVADDHTPLDRYLLPVGNFADTATGVDVLAAFLLATASGNGSDGDATEESYASAARARLSQIKENTPFLDDVRQLLIRYFQHDSD
ncbi:carboxypeptidase regulatory-like domain-containing protein [Streptomyces sp. NPDC005890]|uniref:carboxypeptidase regulatory-like domain-containing protein n=1 Tax=Streptomyces sp. NPDC005890 TaxID=3154568 RepID=UPI0033CCD0D2